MSTARPIHFGDPVRRLRGIGPRQEEELAERGVRTLGDLLEHLPFRYEDRRRPLPLSDARPGEVLTAIGEIVSTHSAGARRRRLNILTVVIDDGTSEMRVLFFNRPYLAEYFEQGARVLVHGAVRLTRHGLEMHAPEFEILRPGGGLSGVTGWIPVYEKVGPLKARRVRQAIAVILDGLEEIDDPLDAEMLSRLGLPSRLDAFRQVHRPGSSVDESDLRSRCTAGHRRLAFDEFFLLEAGLALRRARRMREKRCEGYRLDEDLRRRLAAVLPFKLTAAQQRVLGEIGEDLKAAWPMSRLLMGDVGSGKTIVALLAMLVARENGFQAALMAPTEVLARQHAAGLQALLQGHSMTVDLLSAGIPMRQQKQVRARIEDGLAQLIVGTHSLISEKVKFKKLGMVVIDEQHRFGVVQRADLVSKGAHPDVLVMSATPIPRTLAMVLYGDLDVSILDEKPPGRRPIRTVVRRADQREQVFRGLRQAIDEGRQIYVVRPAVEDGAKSGLRAAQQAPAEFRAAFPDKELRIGIVHGKMKAEERQERLESFKAGNEQILVATTVIEVGIDIASASVILVEDAERFGLAQLHQLRGRVGRGDLKSYCVLIASEGADPEALERLRVLEETDDGFRVAEKDLCLRGAGEVAGTAQSGMPSFRVADLVRHKELLLIARNEAFRHIDSEGRTSFSEALRREILRKYGTQLRLAETG